MFRRIIVLIWLTGMGLGVVSCQVSLAMQSVAQDRAPEQESTQLAISTALPSATATSKPTLTRTFTPSITPTPTLSPTAVATRTPTRAISPVVSEIGRSARVPILMYHYVSVPPADADAIRRDLSVPPEVFEQEMKFLYDQGYQTIQLRDLLNYFETGAPLPPKPIILTFDDGYADQYINVFPTLNDFGFTGTFFVITQFADRNLNGYMTWEQIQELASNGMEIGTHTIDHRANLAGLGVNTQRHAIQPARDALQKFAPDASPVFAYPAGSYDKTTLALLRELGYRAAVTTKQGVLQSSAQPYELKRVRVRGAWTISQFAYWLAYWQKR